MVCYLPLAPCSDQCEPNDLTDLHLVPFKPRFMRVVRAALERKQGLKCCQKTGGSRSKLLADDLRVELSKALDYLQGAAAEILVTPAGAINIPAEMRVPVSQFVCQHDNCKILDSYA
jgi:hypothetical protein